MSTAAHLVKASYAFVGNAKSKQETVLSGRSRLLAILPIGLHMCSNPSPADARSEPPPLKSSGSGCRPARHLQVPRNLCSPWLTKVGSPTRLPHIQQRLLLSNKKNPTFVEDVLTQRMCQLFRASRSLLPLAPPEIALGCLEDADAVLLPILHNMNDL